MLFKSEYPPAQIFRSDSMNYLIGWGSYRSVAQGYFMRNKKFFKGSNDFFAEIKEQNPGLEWSETEVFTYIIKAILVMENVLAPHPYAIGHVMPDENTAEDNCIKVANKGRINLFSMRDLIEMPNFRHTIFQFHQTVPAIPEELFRSVCEKYKNWKDMQYCVDAFNYADQRLGALRVWDDHPVLARRYEAGGVSYAWLQKIGTTFNVAGICNHFRHKLKLKREKEQVRARRVRGLLKEMNVLDWHDEVTDEARVFAYDNKRMRLSCVLPFIEERIRQRNMKLYNQAGLCGQARKRSRLLYVKHWDTAEGKEKLLMSYEFLKQDKTQIWETCHNNDGSLRSFCRYQGGA